MPTVRFKSFRAPDVIRGGVRLVPPALELVYRAIERIRERVVEERTPVNGGVKLPIHQEAKRLTYYLFRKRSIVPGCREAIKELVSDPYVGITAQQPLVQCLFYVFRYGYDDKLVKRFCQLIDKILEVGA